MNLNVTLINRSDSLGGAAIATMRLMNALNHAGASARMLVLDKRTCSDRVARVGNAFSRQYNFLAERFGIYCRNRFDRNTLFKIDTATHGTDVSSHPWVQQAHVVVLGWVNQGMMALGDVRRLLDAGKPLVWVMHDMWNCTGVCHHAGACTAHHGTCRSCPLLGTNGNDLSTATQQRKRELYNSGSINFVAVSSWLEQCCRQSSLMGDARISVIANPFPTSDFGCDFATDNIWNIDPTRTVVVMGAARLDDPVKGFDTLIHTTHYIAHNMPQLAQKLHLVLYGNLRDASLLNRIEIPYTHLGYVCDLQQVYSHAHIVLSTSQVESFGYTLVEGMACGCTAVTTGAGGQTDIVRHLEDGYVAPSAAPHHLAQGLEWAVNNLQDRHKQHRSIEQRFDQNIIAGQHLSLYRTLMN